MSDILEEFIKRENLIATETCPNSPSGRFGLTIFTYRTAEKYWNITKAELYDDRELICSIVRNYPHFPFAWAVRDKKEYLIASDDYHGGQGVIDLVTMESHLWSPLAGSKDPFCWAHVEQMKGDESKLVVHGCTWNGPYEVVIYDFTNPMSVPYTELSRQHYLGPESMETKEEAVDGIEYG